MTQLLFLELNELNFDDLRVYVERGRLPNFAQLLREHGLARTTSETQYTDLEPWIQWVTAHTGLSRAEHGVFRLGDIVHHELIQIWEWLEDAGLKVGAISPMNAKHRLKSPAFFVPDPWTRTAITARPLLRRLHEAVCQATNENARARLTPRSVAQLLTAAAYYARKSNYGVYASLVASARAKPWRKAILLDLLLADVFIQETKRAMPDFVSLFLNAAAHIQHHYMFNSAAYRGNQKNPEWYVSPSDDPVLDVYEAYDRIVGQVRKAFPDARLMIATGLHQQPHRKTTYYWRLKDHGAFLRELEVPFVRVEPRMSRDFLVVCDSESQATAAEGILTSAIAEDGERLFEVDNRGLDLFVTLVFQKDIPERFSYGTRTAAFFRLRDKVAFVAIKNGEHNGTGYFLDTGARLEQEESFPLADLPARVCEAFGLTWSSRTSRATSAPSRSRLAQA